MPNFFFDGSYGGVALKFGTIEMDRGRDVAVQSPSRGNKHVLQDRGQVMGKISAEILFIDEPNADDYLDRYLQFAALANGDPSSGLDPGPQVFFHPIYGGFLARAGQMKERLSSEGQVAVTCEFYPEDEPQTTFPIGAGVAPAAGVEAVSAAADDADTQLAAVGLTAPETAASVDAATSWDAAGDDLDSQAVYLAVASLTQQISDRIDELDLATDITRWQAYRSMINLASQVSRAGDAATSASEQVFTLTVAKSSPLRVICAQVYGASAANDQADAIAKRNRLRTPGLVPAGTVLTMTRDGATG